MFHLTNADLVIMFGLAVLGAILTGALSSSFSPAKLVLRSIGIVASAVLAVLAVEILPALI